jgi:hypothetical protein
MPGQGAGRQWARLIAAVAVRMGVSTNEVRRMAWVDLREVLRIYGVKVRQTPQELSESIERLIRGQDDSDRNSRG